MTSSRVRHFENEITRLKFTQVKKALRLVMKEMCSEKGFSRHDGSHYYYHCVDVAQILYNFGVRDQDVLSAALLHDIIEDVKGFTFEIIESLFNTRVARMVDYVTKKPYLNYKTAAVLQSYLDTIEEDMWASLIKVADRMHNFNTLRYCSFEKKIRQASETKNFFIEFIKRCRERYPQFNSFFFFAKTVIEPHLWEIEAHHDTIVKYKKKIQGYKIEVQGYKQEIQELKAEMDEMKKRYESEIAQLKEQIKQMQNSH